MLSKIMEKKSFPDTVLETLGNQYRKNKAIQRQDRSRAREGCGDHANSFSQKVLRVGGGKRQCKGFTEVNFIVTGNKNEAFHIHDI